MPIHMYTLLCVYTTVCLHMCMYYVHVLNCCRAEIVEKEQMLRTRAMRERDEMKMFVKHYRFVLLRVRMPDGLILQGTLTTGSSNEQLSNWN